MYKFVCYRDLDSGDAQDYAYTLDTVENMIWAEASYSSDPLDMHSAFGWFDITLSSAAPVVVVDEETGETEIVEPEVVVSQGEVVDQSDIVDED